MIDTARLKGLIDPNVMQTSHVVVIGVGGSASFCKNIARLGVGKLELCDFDIVSATNVATQGYGAHQIGQFKVKALAEEIQQINPNVEIITHIRKLEEVSETALKGMLNADLWMAMTDHFWTQALINKLMVKYKINGLFAGAHPGCAAVEISGTFPEAIAKGAGCHRCHVAPRYQAYANGFDENDPIPSQVFQAETLNSMLGHMAVALLHHEAGSELGNAHIARIFMQRPFLLHRIDPFYLQGLLGPADDSELSEVGLFSSRGFDQQMDADQTCPDCGTTPGQAGTIPNLATQGDPQ